MEVFAHFLRFKTVSSTDAVGHAVFPSEFKAAHKFLADSFPNVYSTLHVEEVTANFLCDTLGLLACSQPSELTLTALL